MATELVLSYGDGRVRVVFQHAPVWEKDVVPGSCPPQGLKLFRVMICKEALRDTPPTAISESTNPPKPNNPIFYRSVSPFHWHKKWSGTAWTWGVQAGNKGWAIDELDDNEDAWHGNAPTEVWNLRLQGGLFVQTPRVIGAGPTTDLFRIAWLPTDGTLLRLEAGIMALKPIEDDDSTLLVGFEPPSLVSYRCDVLSNMGDLEGQPSFVRDSQLQQQQQEGESQQQTAYQ